MIELLASLIILTVGAALSYKDIRISLVASIVAVLAMMAGGNAYSALILSVALLNIFSLYAMRQNQIAGVDYALVAIMAVATLYVFMVDDLAMMLVLFMVVSAPTYLLVMVSDEKLNVDVGIKYVTFMVIATVLFIIGAVLLYSATDPLVYSLAFLMLIVGLSMEVGIAPVHEWVPDVFASADPIPVSIIASLAKFVPFIIAYKIIIATATPLAVAPSDSARPYSCSINVCRQHWSFDDERTKQDSCVFHNCKHGLHSCNFCCCYCRKRVRLLRNSRRFAATLRQFIR